MRSDPVDLRLVPAALTAWAATAAGIAWGLGPAVAAICSAVGIGWAVAVRLLGDRHPLLCAARVGVLGVAVVGCAFGLAAGLRSDAVAHHPITGRFGATAWVTVIPGEGPRVVGGGRLMFRGDLARVGDDEMTGAVTVFATGSDFGRLTPGQPARFRARVSRPSRHDLTVAVLTAAGRPSLGSAPAVQRMAQSLRDGFAAAGAAVLPADQAAMLPGLVLGDTSTVTPTTIAEFRTAGLTHLMAVSGANVSIVCGALLLSARLIGPRPAVALAAAGLAAFVIVVQPGASVLRAAIMASIGLLAVLSSRRRQAVPALAGTVILVMMVTPQLAVDAGFALSVSATAALVVLAPIWSQRLVTRGWPKPAADALWAQLLAKLDARGFGQRKLMIEPGRSLVGNAGVCVTEVLYLKPGEQKNFCIVDAAMNDLPRPAMYQAFHRIVPLQEHADHPSLLCDVVGPVCESGDWIGRDRQIQAQAGEYLAVLSAGAYCVSMSSNYNSRPRAAELLVDGEAVHVLRERESVAGLFAGEQLR